MALGVFAIYFDGYIVGCKLFSSAHFDIPYCRDDFVKFFFGVSILTRGEFRPRQTRQLPRAVYLKGRLLSCKVTN